MKKIYSSPTLVAVGTIAGETLQVIDKNFGVGDSSTFQGNLTCVEPCAATSA